MIENILSMLKKVKKSSAYSYRSICPAHKGNSQSLSIRVRDTGKVDIHCFAECQGADVMAAIGLTLADLYPDRIEPPIGLGKERRFNSYDVLAGIASESLIIAHLASELQTYPLNKADHDRLFLAVKRIRTAAKLVGVHHG